MTASNNLRLRPARYIDREQTIIRCLKDRHPVDGAATIKEIWETVAELLKEQVSLSAYYKVVEKMVVQHKLEVIESATPAEPVRYKVAPHLFAENAVTLVDLEELWAMAPGDAVAHYVDALDYFQEKQATSLARAAEALCEEDPIELVLEMIRDQIECFNKGLSLWRETDLQEPSLQASIKRDHERLRRFAYGWLGIPGHVLNLESADRLLADHNLEIRVDQSTLRELMDVLEHRIVGTKFLFEIDADEGFSEDEKKRAVIVGSDGSTHVGVLGGVTAPRFFEDPDEQIVSFNNSIGFYDLQEASGDNRDSEPLTGVPVTRNALQDPSNKGMVLAPFMFDLDPTAYEYMKKCATDVVQFRVDEKLINGTARSLGKGYEKLPRAAVVIRDGTVVPQAREFQHYSRRDEYGEMVQEGIALSASMLSTIMASSAPLVFAGAVKFTELRLFANILNWYMERGSRRKFGRALDPNWDRSRAGHITDNTAMSMLLATLKRRNPSSYFCSCVFIRPFPAIIPDLLGKRIKNGEWLQFFRDKRDEQIREYHQRGGDRPYLDTVDVDADPYPFMCEEADYSMFYIGHTAGDPPPTAPRYEFLDSLRKRSVEELRQRVSEKVRRLVSGLHLTRFSLDSEHNYYTKKALIKIIPYVVYTAHEFCKVLGGKLEAELKSEVVAKLAQLKKLRGLSASQVSLIPLEIRRYLERTHQTDAKKLPPEPDQDDGLS